MRDLPPPELELFDFDAPVDPALLPIVFLPCMNSAEHFVGPGPGIGDLGSAVYGLTRLHLPWLLHRSRSSTAPTFFRSRTVAPITFGL